MSGTCDIIEPKVLLKLQSQFFCIDTRCSLPPDNDVPCLVNLLFLTLVYQVSDLSDIINSIQYYYYLTNLSSIYICIYSGSKISSVLKNLDNYETWTIMKDRVIN